MEKSFSSPLAYWVGMDTIDFDASETEQFNRHYSEVHVPEVVAGNGFTRAHRWVLDRPDPRGDFGPGYLTAYEIPDEAAAQTYIDRANGNLDRVPLSPWPPGAGTADRRETRWRLIWRQISDTGPADVEPERIMLIGINPPDDASPDELTEFNDFYTNVHVPEIVALQGFTRSTRWERLAEIAHPEPGCPRYLGLYEIAPGAKDATPEHMAAVGPPSRGPDVWQRRNTPWRLHYRRMPLDPS